MLNMNRAALYCRLSDEDKDKKESLDLSESIQNQIALLEEYVLKQNWAIYKTYSDDDYSGWDKDRPAFNELIRDAIEGKFNIVVCKTQSRFVRDMESLERYVHDLFPKLGVRFIGIIDNIDTDIRGNKKARQINGLINEWYECVNHWLTFCNFLPSYFDASLIKLNRLTKKPRLIFPKLCFCRIR